MIVHPLQAPQFSWQMFNDKKQGLKFWFRLLRKPLMSPWYKIYHFPWCGWIQFWQARPWRRLF